MTTPPHLTHSPLPRTLTDIMEAPAGNKILVVEDEQDIAQLVRHYLQKQEKLGSDLELCMLDDTCAAQCG